MVKRIAVAGAWAVVAFLLSNLLLRVVAHDRLWLSIVLGTVSTWLYLPAWGALLIALLARRRILLGLAASIAVAHLTWTIGPYTRAERPAERARTLRVFSTNVMAWNGDTDGIVGEILSARPDVVAIQELSPVWAEALAKPEVARLYPYRIVEPRTDASGTGIYSRTPFVDADILPTPSMPIARATLDVQGTRVRLYSVHVLPPRFAEWVDQWNAGLTAILDAAQHETLPVVLAGDFNATQHSAWHGRFLAHGFRSAHELCGRPLATTWPNGVLPIPPVRLDHVFVARPLGCVSIVEGTGRGSDHRPVVVDLGVPSTDARSPHHPSALL